MSANAWLPLAFVLGYLLGSIPFGLVLTRLAGTQDLRSIGSGNIGATNVLRTGRKGLAAATLLLDMLKHRASADDGAHHPAREPGFVERRVLALRFEIGGIKHPWRLGIDDDDVGG